LRVLRRGLSFYGICQVACGETLQQNCIRTGSQSYLLLSNAADQDDGVTLWSYFFDLVEQVPRTLAERFVEQHQLRAKGLHQAQSRRCIVGLSHIRDLWYG
jgi:hypothetical protein